MLKGWLGRQWRHLWVLRHRLCGSHSMGEAAKVVEGLLWVIVFGVVFSQKKKKVFGVVDNWVFCIGLPWMGLRRYCRRWVCTVKTSLCFQS